MSTKCSSGILPVVIATALIIPLSAGAQICSQEKIQSFQTLLLDAELQLDNLQTKRIARFSKCQKKLGILKLERQRSKILKQASLLEAQCVNDTPETAASTACVDMNNLITKADQLRLQAEKKGKKCQKRVRKLDNQINSLKDDAKRYRSELIACDADILDDPDGEGDSPRRGVIRLLSFTGVQETKAEIIIQGQGYAQSEDGLVSFFWKADPAPLIELRIPNTARKNSFPACLAAVRDGAIPAGMAMELNGTGTLQESGLTEAGSVAGVFTIDQVFECDIVQPS